MFFISKHLYTLPCIVLLEVYIMLVEATKYEQVIEHCDVKGCPFEAWLLLRGEYLCKFHYLVEQAKKLEKKEKSVNYLDWDKSL